MAALRLPLAVGWGAALTAAVFWVLWQLVSQPIDIGTVVTPREIVFTRQIAPTPLDTKRDERVERKPPSLTPSGPGLDVGPSGPPTRYVPAERINVALDPTVGGAGGLDRDVIPLVRIPPEYPQRAVARNIEGWVQLQFSISETGAVEDAVVIAADPPGVFDDAALAALERWRYNPRVTGGMAVKRVGVQTVIRFELGDE